MSEEIKSTGPDAEAPKRVLRDLDVQTKDADQVKAGAKRREDPCAGGE